MNKERIIHTTADEVPRPAQLLKLRCVACGTRAGYDVGAVFQDPQGEGAAPKECYTFTNYFRCQNCRSGGPWEIEDLWKLAVLKMRAAVDRKFDGFFLGHTHLFDGTCLQTPAMGEDYLLKLIQAEPRNAFLHTRLGNLLRGCGQADRCAEWYHKAVTLDPGDVEARYHLLSFAADAEDTPSEILHAPLLVRALLEGRTTNVPELTKGLAHCVVDLLRSSDDAFARHFLKGRHSLSDRKEDRFIRSLLVLEGDEDEILAEAAERLLQGKPEPAVLLQLDSPEPAGLPKPDLIPSLRDLVHAAALEPEKLVVAFLTDGQGHVRVEDRHAVSVSDGNKMTLWKVPSLRALFRGCQAPPPDMDHYPPAYAPYFFFLENQVLTLCDALGDQTDQDFEAIYAELRRRPDGRSLGAAHDLVWQVAALLLGRYPLSQAEFEAMIGALVRSTRKWSLRPISRNYVAYLRNTFGDDHATDMLPL